MQGPILEAILVPVETILWLSNTAVLAYIGPGAGLSAIAAFFAALAGIIVALLGFVWYPIKRLLRKTRASRNRKRDEGE